MEKEQVFKLTPRDQKVEEQDKIPLAKLIKKLKYTPLNERIITLALSNSEKTKSGIIVNSTGQLDDATDAIKYARKVIAIDFKLGQRLGIKVGDKLLISSGGIEYTLNGVLINEFRGHEVAGILNKDE